MKLLKLTVLVAMVLTLSACEDSAKILSFKALPDSLKDCTFIRLKNRDQVKVTVVRCPNSTTSVKEQAGKSVRNSVVIDGVIYEEKK